MGNEILTFDDIEIETSKSNYHMNPAFQKDVDIEEVLVSNQISLGEKNVNTLLVICSMMIKLSYYI